MTGTAHREALCHRRRGNRGGKKDCVSPGQDPIGVECGQGDKRNRRPWSTEHAKVQICAGSSPFAEPGIAHEQGVNVEGGARVCPSGNWKTSLKSAQFRLRTEKLFRRDYRFSFPRQILSSVLDSDTDTALLKEWGQCTSEPRASEVKWRASRRLQMGGMHLRRDAGRPTPQLQMPETVYAFH